MSINKGHTRVLFWFGMCWWALIGHTWSHFFGRLPRPAGAPSKRQKLYLPFLRLWVIRVQLLNVIRGWFAKNSFTWLQMRCKHFNFFVVANEPWALLVLLFFTPASTKRKLNFFALFQIVSLHFSFSLILLKYEYWESDRNSSCLCPKDYVQIRISKVS
jgi:hypothetical protein